MICEPVRGGRVGVRVAVFVCMAILLLAGCSANIREKHFFASYPGGDTSKPPVNFYRLSIEGDTQFSNARYLAGFYDERAVDLFFSELKSDQTLFPASQKDPGSQDVLKPLDPTDHGTFVMILSTNADAIADAIGAFADSEVVGNAITQLANRSQLKKAAESDASAGSTKASASAFTDELKSRLDAAGEATDATAAEAAYLQAVNLIARELGRPQGFATLNDALIWLQAEKPQ